MLKYPVRIFWSDEDEGYIALVPDLPGCCAWGATKAQALKEIQQAALAWLEVAKKMNRKIPTPEKTICNQQLSTKDDLYIAAM